MTTKRSIRTLVLAAVSFTTATAITLVLPFCSPSFTAEAKTKMVTFRVRDDTAYAVELHCKSREHDITVEPGKTVSLKVAIGDTLIAKNSTPHYPAGTTLVVVAHELQDTTLAIH